MAVEPPTPTATLQPDMAAVLNGPEPRAETALQTDEDKTLATVEVVKLLRPSVVHIATETLTMETFMQPAGVLGGVGTGIVLTTDGYILTNNHVVAGAERIIVTLDSGESFLAELVGGDPTTDTAIIRIDAEGLQPATLGESSKSQVGEDVIAIGHALGLPGGPTVSKGVVSALGRSIVTGAQTTMVDMIQTDASINPGNSGGPLVNDRAEVVGINTAIIEEGQGIGFAINIDDAKVAATQLIEQGFVRRGYLGITPVNLTAAVVSQFDLQVPEQVVQGILVLGVALGFPADDAGLQAGDIIVQLGDEPIANTGEMSKFLLNHPPGETVKIVYYKGGVETTGEITLGERPPG